LPLQLADKLGGLVGCDSSGDADGDAHESIVEQRQRSVVRDQ
jgi:hypothetical protein